MNVYVVQLHYVMGLSVSESELFVYGQRTSSGGVGSTEVEVLD